MFFVTAGVGCQEQGLHQAGFGALKCCHQPRGQRVGDKELSLRGCVCDNPTADCKGSQRSWYHQVCAHVSPERWHTQPIQIPEEQGTPLFLYITHSHTTSGVTVTTCCVMVLPGCRRGSSERWVSRCCHHEALRVLWEGGQIFQPLCK